MKNFVSFTFLSQIVLIFSLANPALGNNPSQKMTCFITSTRRLSGLAVDCYDAIAFLYVDPFPACAICRTCVVEPLNGKQQKLGGHVNNQGIHVPPKLSKAEMNAGYHAKFSGFGYDGTANCDNYVLPPGVVLAPKERVPAPGKFYSPFLLSTMSGQGPDCVPCNATLTQEVYDQGG